MSKEWFAPYKGIQDSIEFWIPRRGLFRTPGSPIFVRVELDSEFQSLVGFWFSLAIFWIPTPGFRPNFTRKIFLDSEFNKRKLSGFRILQAKTFLNPESGLPHMRRMVHNKSGSRAIYNLNFI